jgi:hypothetical protein
MREKYQEEKAKQGEINVAPSTLTPWYEIFDNIFGNFLESKVCQMGHIKGCIWNMKR